MSRIFMATCSAAYGTEVRSQSLLVYAADSDSALGKATRDYREREKAGMNHQVVVADVTDDCVRFVQRLEPQPITQEDSA